MSTEQQNPSLGGSAMKPFDVAGLFRRYGLVMAVLAAGAFLLLAPLAALLAKPYYETWGRIQIERSVQPLIAAAEPVSIVNYFHDYAQTQVRKIVSPDVLDRAVESLPPDIRATIQPAGAPLDRTVEALERRLEVSQIYGTHLIQIILRGPKADGLADIVNAVMRAYVEQLFKEQENMEAARIQYLGEAREQQRKELDALEEELRAIAGRTVTSTFSETFNAPKQRLLELQQAHAQTYADSLAKLHAWQELRASADALRALPIQSLADELVAGDESLWSISSWTYRSLQEMRTTLDGTTSDNPDRRYIENRMQAMQNYESDLKEKVSERALRIVRDKRDYELDRRVIQAGHDYEAARKTEEDLGKALSEAEAKAAATAVDIIRAQEIAARLEHLRGKLFSFQDRIVELTTESRSPLRIGVQAWAREPGGQAGNNLKKLLALCLALSFGGVELVFVAGEFADKRLRSPRDLAKAVGGPVAWPVSQHGQGPFHRMTLDYPGDPAAKSVRSLAARLDGARTGPGGLVALFTGVEGRVGTTSLLLNTAHAMANFYDKVLVVEANLSNTGLSRMLGVERPATEGGGEGDDPSFADTVLRDEERGLSAMLIDETRWTRLEGAQLAGVIGSLRGSFDVVLIDSAPIMESDLTEFLVRNADVAVLVAQGDRTPYPKARFAAELLASLRVPVMTAILNWGGPRESAGLDRLLSRIPFAGRLVRQTRRF